MAPPNSPSQHVAVCGRLSIPSITVLACLVLAPITRAGQPDDIPGPVSLFLPDTIYAVPDIETNVYFDNVALVLDPRDYAFDVTCDKGAQQAERWTFTPADEDLGDYPFALEVRDTANNIIARDTASIHVSSRNAHDGDAVSMLLIGDSLTHASGYSQHLLDLCGTPGNPVLSLVGSHIPDEANPLNRHEGYGGWTAQRFATLYTGVAREGDYHKRGSPFLYLDEAGEPKLNFEHYCQDVNEGKHPDVVTIFLGCNDTFSATDDTIADRIGEMFTYLDRLLTAIHTASPETRIGIIAPVPPASSQDAFGANYKSGQTRWQYKRNQHAVVRAMYERYAANEVIPVTLIPAFTNLDCARNYPVSAASWNARSNEETNRQNNGVHPNDAGYRQIGDSIFCWLKSE